MHNSYPWNETDTVRIPKDKGLNSTEIKKILHSFLMLTSLAFVLVSGKWHGLTHFGPQIARIKLRTLICYIRTKSSIILNFTLVITNILM